MSELARERVIRLGALEQRIGRICSLCVHLNAGASSSTFLWVYCLVKSANEVVSVCGAAGVQTSSLFSGEHPVVEKCRRRSEIQRTVLLLLLLLLLLEIFVLVGGIAGTAAAVGTLCMPNISSAALKHIPAVLVELLVVIHPLFCISLSHAKN